MTNDTMGKSDPGLHWLATHPDPNRARLIEGLRAGGATIVDFYRNLVGTAEGVEEKSLGITVRVRTSEGLSFYRPSNFLGFDVASDTARLDIGVEPFATQRSDS